MDAAAAAAIGWYGPLIDLANAAFHIGSYVQLIVFVHLFRPIKKFKASNGRALLKTDVQVGDDTRSYFPVSLWQKQMGSMISAGDIILLQSEVIKFGDVLEAATVQSSSLLLLVHRHELLPSKGVAEILATCQLGRTTKEKLKKVIEWVQQTESMNHHSFHQSKDMAQPKRRISKNWKMQKERKLLDCICVSEVLCLIEPCIASFNACVGEIVLSFAQDPKQEGEKERLFVSKRLFAMGDVTIAEDLICTGCKLCGSPMDFCSLSEQGPDEFYCLKSSNHHHDFCCTYRPFLLYVWDEFDHIPVLVKNTVAEILFGNITAESVHLSLNPSQVPRKNEICDQEEDRDLQQCDRSGMLDASRAEADAQSSVAAETSRAKGKGTQLDGNKVPNFYRIWLIVLKMLLQQGKNSPFSFEVSVNSGKDEENGRFELLSFAMPSPQYN